MKAKLKVNDEGTVTLVEDKVTQCTLLVWQAYQLLELLPQKAREIRAAYKKHATEKLKVLREQSVEVAHEMARLTELVEQMGREEGHDLFEGSEG